MTLNSIPRFFCLATLATVQSLKKLFGRGASGADKSKYVDSKYLTLDLSLQYKVQKDYKIYAKAYNLTNASYAETGGVSNGKYSFPMPGRSFLIGMEYAF